jgi:membrane protease YdiL (CAAX protease family)
VQDITVRPVIQRGRIAAFVALFLALWCAAWSLRFALGDQWPPSADLAYWVSAKLLVWGAFPIVFWRGRLPGGQAAFIGLGRDAARRGLLVGAAAAVGWVALSFARAALGGLTVAAPAAPLAALYAILLTPWLEELVFRGYLQSTLVAAGGRFAYVNCLGAALFLLVHALGWAFQGVLGANLLSVYPVSIVGLSLLLGLVRHRTGSLLAAVTLHTANNVFATFVRF